MEAARFLEGRYASFWGQKGRNCGQVCNKLDSSLLQIRFEFVTNWILVSYKLDLDSTHLSLNFLPNGAMIKQRGAHTSLKIRTERGYWLLGTSLPIVSLLESTSLSPCVLSACESNVNLSTFSHF
jgi:hypothetical protein